MTELEKDAARYRWLKRTNGAHFRDDLEMGVGAIGPIMRGDGHDCSTSLSPDEMDAAIDAWRARWPQ